MNSSANHKLAFRFKLLVLASVASFTLITRYYGTNWGFPHLYHDDEWQIVFRALRMVETEDLNPHFFNYPGLLFYTLAALFNWYTKFASLTPAVSTITDLPAWHFFFIARLFSATLGCVTVALLYLAGRRAVNATAGICAAILMASSFLHVQYSHFAVTDVPLTFFTTLTLYCTLRLLLQPSDRRWQLAAGVAVGMTGSMKYNGMIIIITPIIALLQASLPKKLKAIGRVSCLAGLTFTLVNPYILLDFPKFWRDFYSEIVHYSSGHLGYTSDLPPYLYYLEYLRIDFGLLSCLLMLGGLVFLGLTPIRAVAQSRLKLTVGKEGKTDAETLGSSVAGLPFQVSSSSLTLPLLLFPILYFLWLSSVQALFVRNVLCILPFVMLSAGWLLAHLEVRVRFLVQRPFIAAAGVICLLIASSWTSLQQVWNYSLGFRQEMTYTLAARWLDSYTQNLAGPFAIVQFAWIPLPLSDKFVTRYLVPLPMNQDIFQFVHSNPDLQPIAAYYESKVEFVTVSGWVYNQHRELPEWNQYFTEVLSHCRLLKVIPGRYKFYWKPECGPAGCQVNPGPTLWIYAFEPNSQEFDERTLAPAEPAAGSAAE